MKLLTTEFLRDSGTLADLAARYGITAKRHGVYPNLVHLKYAQCGSPMEEPIVQECRGLILDEADGWRVVSFPYTKFFNHGEPNAVALDWSTAKVYEKLDGSLMTLYWYGNRWNVASSGTPDAAGPAHGSALTFADLFWKTWTLLGYRLPAPPENDDVPLCYIFELMTPFNRVIVPHATGRIVLHGVRDLETFEECQPEPCAASINWECVRSFPLGTVEEIIAAAGVLNPMECEGYVVRDAAFRRVKVKSPQYVALAHLKDGINARRILDIIRKNETSEFLAHFPEWKGAFSYVRNAFDELCLQVETEYEAIKGIEVQKDFAAVALKSKCSAALFAIRSRKVATVRDYFAGCSMQAMERTIGMEAIDTKVNAAICATA